MTNVAINVFFYSSLFDATGVEGLVEGGGVAGVLGKGGGEAVGAVHGGRGTEIEVVCLLGLEDSLDGGLRWQAYWGRWQAGVQVGVERTLHCEVHVEDAPQGEVAHGILHRRVGLQQHAFLQPVEIHAGYQRFLGTVVGLFFDYRRKDDYVLA